jgi:flagellar biosynthetic protein FliS
MNQSAANEAPGIGTIPEIAVSTGEAKPIPEHMVVLLLEGAQRFLEKAEAAIHRREPLVRDHHLNKVLAILKELHRCLNHDQGGPLVESLIQVYAWWGQEVQAAGAADDAHRLQIIASQMGEIRKTWEHVLFKGEGMSETPER